MVSIPKCKRKALSNSENFPAITLSSIIVKLFDWVILLKEQKALMSSDLQFGFKQDTSISQCSFVMLETINFYNFNGSSVYILYF